MEFAQKTAQELPEISKSNVCAQQPANAPRPSPQRVWGLARGGAGWVGRMYVCNVSRRLNSPIRSTELVVISIHRNPIVVNGDLIFDLL
jgi:hypothetical protein